MRDKFIQTLAEIARKDPRVILITGDLGFKVLDSFKKEFNIIYYPLFNDRYINNLYTNNGINYFQIFKFNKQSQLESLGLDLN